MQYNATRDAYEGVTSDGHKVVVDSDEYAEVERDSRAQGISEASIEAELTNPDTWAACVGENDRVWFEDVIPTPEHWQFFQEGHNAEL